jgi:hypothetical protein
VASLDQVHMDTLLQRVNAHELVRCDFTSSVWVGIVEIRTRYFKLTRA